MRPEEQAARARAYRDEQHRQWLCNQIRNAALEEAARMAEGAYMPKRGCWVDGNGIARAIRALKEGE